MSDTKFFAGLDLKRPGMEAVSAAVQKSDWPAARAAFGRYFKQRKSPRWLEETRPASSPKNRRFNTRTADETLQHHRQWQNKTFDLGPTIDWSSNPMNQGESRTLEWNASLNRHYHLQNLAEAYRATGEDKYAVEAVSQILDWIEKCPVLTDRSGNSPYHYAWETLNTGVRAGHTWPDVIYMIMNSPALGDEAVCTIAKSLVEHARHLDQWPTKRGNWLTMESTGLLAVGVLLPEFREADTWRAHGIERLYRQMHTDIYPDGLQIELAIGYNTWVLRNFGRAYDLAVLNDRSKDFPSDYVANLERMYAYLAYIEMPNGFAPGLNDTSGLPAKSLKENLNNGLKYFPKREDIRWLATDGKQGKRPETTSMAFPYSGHYVMRSDWDKDARYLLLDAGPFGAGHQHEDKLHLIAYAYGRHLLLDAGNYMYDKSRWRRYVISTRGHNTIRVDGADQNRKRLPNTWVLPEPFQPSKNTWISNDRLDYVAGRYDNGYGPKGDIKVAHKRAVAFIKPDYWVVFDTLEPRDQNVHQYESIFHLGAEAAAIVKGRYVATENKKTSNLILWPLPTGTLQIVLGRENEPVQGWAHNPDWRPVPTAVVTCSRKGKTRMATVLYPLPAEKTSPIDAVKLLPVSKNKWPADDAVAISIHFHDGRVHTILSADEPGVVRRAGDLKTDAVIEWMESKAKTK